MLEIAFTPICCKSSLCICTALNSNGIWCQEVEIRYFLCPISVLRGQESDNVLHVLPMEKARGGKWRQPPSGLVQETRTHH